MGHQIIQEPGRDSDGNPRYSVFSSEVDNVIIYNATEAQIIGFFMDQAKWQAREDAQRALARIKSGEPPRRPFGLDYQSMIETIELHHGKKEAQNVRKMIEAPAC